MVMKESDIRGDEQTGTGEVLTAAVSTAAAVGAALVRGGRQITQSTSEKERPRQQTPPELRGAFRQDLYQAFLDKGVPEEVASDAADAVMLGKDADSSPALFEAHRIVEGGQQANTEEGIEDRSKEADEEAKGEEETTEGSQEEATSTDQKSVTAQAPLTTPQQSQQTAQQVAQSAPGQTTSSSKKVEISQPPSEMSWQALRQTAKAIRLETGEKPKNNNKKSTIEFVENYQAQQQQEKLTEEAQTSQADAPSQTGKTYQAQQQRTQYSSTVATPAVEKAPIVRPSKPSLEKDYSAGLEAAKVDSKIAAKAAKALVNGEGADTNAALQSAHAQVQQKAKPVVQTPLQKLYADVLKRQGIQPELAEAASKDLADGKGAHSSRTVRQAHKTILDRELMTTGGKTLPKRIWQKHSRYVTEKNPHKRDQAIAKNASKAGMSQAEVERMLQLNSPVVSNIQSKESPTQAIRYLKRVASEASQRANRSKSTSLRKSPINSKVKRKGKGIEV